MAALPAYAWLLEDLNAFGGPRFEPLSMTIRDGRPRLVTSVTLPDGAGTVLRLDHGVAVTGDRPGTSTAILTSLDPESFPDGGEASRELFGDAVPLRLDSEYVFRSDGGREAHHALALAPLGLDADDEAWRFDGAELDLRLRWRGPDASRGDLGALTAFARTGALRYVGTDGLTLRVDPTVWLADLDASPGAGALARLELVASGEVNGSVPLAGLTMPLGVEGLRATVTLDRDGGTLRLAMASSVDGIDVPMVPIDALDVRAELFGLPGAWTDLAWAEAIAPAADGGDPEAAVAALAEALLPALYASMLEDGLGASLSVHLTNGGGEVDLDVRVALAEGTGVRPVEEWTTVRDLVRATRASLSLDADAAALRQLPVRALLDDPRAAMVLKRVGMRYTSRIELDDRTVRINGMPLGLELFLADRLDEPLRLPGGP